MMKNYPGSHYYRRPAEIKLAREIEEAREELLALIASFAVRLLDFRTDSDVWVKISDSMRVGLIGENGYQKQIVLEENETKRGMSQLEVRELVHIFGWLKKLKCAVINESIDYLGEVQSAIKTFREDVMDLAE